MRSIRALLILRISWFPTSHPANKVAGSAFTECRIMQGKQDVSVLCTATKRNLTLFYSSQSTRNVTVITFPHTICIYNYNKYYKAFYWNWSDCFVLSSCIFYFHVTYPLDIVISGNACHSMLFRPISRFSRAYMGWENCRGNTLRLEAELSLLNLEDIFSSDNHWYSLST